MTSPLPDAPTDPYRIGRPPVDRRGDCELCGTPRRADEPHVCDRCVQAYPTLAEALRSPANDAAR